MNNLILIVDDDALLRRSLAFSLEQVGYQISAMATAEAALVAVQQDPPDLILLDISLPGMDGLAALRHLQALTNAPIIFLTAHRRELDEVVGLELGADDYITKPFAKDVLLARIRTSLRRTSPTAPTPSEPTLLTVGDLVIDVTAFTVTLQGKTVPLSAREFRLLQTLAQHQGEVLALDTLINQVWGAEYTGEPQAVYIYIRTLRQKLETIAPDCRCRIVTVRGAGYKLVAEAE
ncbi:MAG: response regulator transcription factor [Caldilineaceae bacterium]